MGFVQLSDGLSSWEWFDDKNTVYVYLWLMLRAAWCATRYHGIEIERGQIITTYPEIAEKCDVTIRQARTILDRLKTTGKATVKTTSKFSIITMLEYDCNGKSDSLNDSQMTDKRQTARQSNDSPTLLLTNIQNTDNQTPRAPREGERLEKSFNEFWSAYPKKTAKAQALKSWQKIKPDDELVQKILSALERHKRSAQWLKDNGQYIPYPASWLNGKRWEDELQEENNGKSNRDISNRSKSDWLAGFE